VPLALNTSELTAVKNDGGALPICAIYTPTATDVKQ
jgi:hypothetical protein